MTDSRGELPHLLDAAKRRLELSWDEPRVEEGLERLHRTIRVRRATSTICASLVAAGATAWLIVAGPRISSGGPPVLVSTPAVTAPVAQVWRFSDGSSAVPLAANTEISVGEDSPSHVTTRLERGRGRFVVTRKPSRIFRVEAGEVVVTVLGTDFEIDRTAGAATIAVREGTVRVDWAGQERLLTAGERATFGHPAAASATDQAPLEAPAAAGSSPSRSAVALPRRDSWLALGEKERFDEAFVALRSVQPSQINAPEHLLLAADVARLSGHPSQAQPYLERLISRNPGDPRAPLAAFSLGRLLLNELAQPAAAAQRFAQARALAPSGSLAEDALAREVEAWARAGAAGEARERAREYLNRYPHGQRAVAVRRFGGLP